MDVNGELEALTPKARSQSLIWRKTMWAT